VAAVGLLGQLGILLVQPLGSGSLGFQCNLEVDTLEAQHGYLLHRHLVLQRQLPVPLP